MSKRKIRIAIKECLIVIVVVATLSLLFGEKSPVTTAVEAYIKPTLNTENINVHFIDVGQGSAVLIQQGKQGILIDSGEDDYSGYLCDYILSSGVEYFPYIIASHPHSDHIGGLDEVIRQFTVSEVVMPCIDEKYEPDSDVYTDMLQVVGSTSAKINYADIGERLCAGDINVEIIGPVKQSSNLNNMSVVCKVNAFSTTFVFMGDAEKSEINQIYDTYSEFDCDVLHVPHHGSNTALHDDFFDSISAETAVISCGKNNSYDHPHGEVLDFYERIGCEIYRTDLEGDIIFTCDADGYDIRK